MEAAGISAQPCSILWVGWMQNPAVRLTSAQLSDGCMQWKQTVAQDDEDSEH